jgi:hypothetical protein
MYQTINGVQIRENEETRELPNLVDKIFEIEYLDNVYLHKLVCLDFINIKVKGRERKYGMKFKKDYGQQWMFVVKDNDFVENRKMYGEVACLIHDKIGDFLVKEYGYKPGLILMDSMDKVYLTS